MNGLHSTNTVAYTHEILPLHSLNDFVFLQMTTNWTS